MGRLAAPADAAADDPARLVRGPGGQDLTLNRGRALVAAGHPAVVAAAEETLAAGGTAVDAVVAAGLAGAVAEPCLTSLAGGGFCMVRTPAGEEVLVDFFVDTPGLGLTRTPIPHFEEVVVAFEAAVQPFHCGPGSIAVPGCLPGYLHLHERFGRLELTQVVAPARRLATEGVELLPKQASIVALLEPILMRTAAGRSLFAPAGHLVGAGDRIENTDLGQLLGELGDGHHRGFAAPALRAALLEVTTAEGLVTGADLDAYAVVERAPLEVAWRDRRVLTNPQPSFGGTLLAAALRRLDRIDLAPDDPRWPAAIVRVSAEVDAARPAILAGLDPAVGRTARGTTHVSVWDGRGGAASMTTSNGECSGDVIPGTGILTNNILGEDDLHPDGFHAAPAGRRVSSMMSPSLVLDAAGEVELIVGSGGSKRIRSAVAQVLHHLVVAGRSPRDAVAAPRAHWDVDHVEAEPGLGPAELEALAQVGPVNSWPERSVYFGGAHVAVPGIGAAGDPRRDGAASGS